ncbi:hypothetical protein TRAPUB_13232 [Trametes pubescens]|uniref:Uncharacterized protein n=1 Tax=Trametes pubescens TaxID=154538 RepID=A0A1M2VRK0_TRAPU|nr:hypothetical protein TRAPUB_13232 [Trametes pubescens]
MTLERTPSSSHRPPTPETIHVESKDRESTELEFPGPASFTHASPARDRPSCSARQYSVPQAEDVAMAAPELETVEAPVERLLHLALPWAFGQRVLAMMAGEDTRSVNSNGSEPPPAYEPRR